MRHRFFDIAFTPDVQAEQARYGSRAAYAAATGVAAAEKLSPRELDFLAARDSFYLASVSQTGWPYVQHRGGPAGFVRPIDDQTIGWADYVGNRQYVSAGNAVANDRVALIFMDYPNRRRLKILGRLRRTSVAERPDLAARVAMAGTTVRVEASMLVTVEAFDWNCPQHITPRFTLAEMAGVLAPLQARVAELEALLQARDEAGAGPVAA